MMAILRQGKSSKNYTRVSNITFTPYFTNALLQKLATSSFDNTLTYVFFVNDYDLKWQTITYKVNGI